MLELGLLAVTIGGAAKLAAMIILGIIAVGLIILVSLELGCRVWGLEFLAFLIYAAICVFWITVAFLVVWGIILLIGLLL
jgi:hypothetical protein